MPFTDDPRWSCYRKKAYPTEAIAKKVANKVRYERGADVHHYLCDSCARFHIGSGRWATA